MAQQHNANASPAPMGEPGSYVWPKPIIAKDRLSFIRSVDRSPVADCIGEVDPSTWIIAGSLLLKHHPEAAAPPPGTSWPGGRRWGGYYTLEKAPEPLPKAYPIEESGPRARFELSGMRYGQCVFGIGSVMLKVHVVCPYFLAPAHEHVTLNWLAERKGSFSFEFPEVVAHEVIDGRYYLFVTDLLDTLGLYRLEDRWGSSMTTQQWSAVFDRLDAISCEMAAFKEKCGGSYPPPLSPPVFCDPKMLDPRKCGPDMLEPRNCKRLGLDCPERVFAHNGIARESLRANSILLDEDNKVVGIANWELASFVPREFVVAAGMLSP
ncbi:hypothetical protein RB598_006726 [Gaeumannomyces tritici]